MHGTSIPARLHLNTVAQLHPKTACTADTIHDIIPPLLLFTPPLPPQLWQTMTKQGHQINFLLLLLVKKVSEVTDVAWQFLTKMLYGSVQTPHTSDNK